MTRRRPKARTPLTTFNIYPEKRRSRLHFHVRIFASVAVLREYLKHDDLPRSLGRYGVAMCSTYHVHRNGRCLPILGEILIPLSHFRAGVIAHECTHAAIGWAKRIGLEYDHPTAPKRRSRGHHFARPEEERFCYALGELVRQIAVVGWRKGYAK